MNSMKAATAAVGNQVEQVIKVGGLKDTSGISLFERLPVNKKLLHSDAKICELLEELHGLPLAIFNAARYLNDHTQLIIDEFLTSLRAGDRGAGAFTTQEYSDLYDGKEHQVSLARTLTKSFEAIRRQDQDATMLLELVSWVSSSSMPNAVFSGVSVKKGKKTSEEAIGTLRSFFFLTPKSGDDSYDMPTVVHLSTRIRLQQSKTSHKVTKAVTMRLNKAVPEKTGPSTLYG
ncbi:hypothetical protein FGRMN_8219 [Fusarium graminum]|nr:hypothetical protein FGRMN_8219 [Fusarium graminum]